MMVETISTERLVLRPLRLSDVGPATLHSSDERVARMTTSIPHPYPPGAAQAYIRGILNGRRTEDAWAIDATPSDGEELIGVISYKSGPKELGYWVGPPYWNAGYATEAVKAVVAHLFAVRGIERLNATVFADNAASAAVLIKVGFRKTGQSQNFSVARGESVANRVFQLDRADWPGALENDDAAS